MEKAVFYQPEKQFLLGAKKFFFKNWPPRFDNGFHQQKTQNTISPRQERILQLLFLLVETIIKIRKNQILKKITFFLVMEIRGIQFLKINLIPANGNGFRAFFLLGEIIIEIRRNSVFRIYSCKRKLIHGRGNGLSRQRKPFFSPFFRGSCQFFYVWKKSIFQRNPSFRLVEIVFVCSEFFL